MRGRGGAPGRLSAVISEKEWVEGFEGRENKFPVRPPWEEWSKINRDAGRKDKMYMWFIDEKEMVYNPNSKEPTIKHIPLDAQHIKEL